MSEDVTRELAALGCCAVSVDRASRKIVCSHDSGLSLCTTGPNGSERINSRAPLPYQVSRRDPLGRAIGKGNTQVVDATAGLGGDTLLMLMMGLHVVAIEQSPILYVLLKDRLETMLSAERFGRAQLRCADSNLELTSLSAAPDVVYLDPMFPPRRKTSALPKKELMELRQLAAQPQSGVKLLDTALGVASNRVVVKRLPESEPIAAAPDWHHEGKTVRYDVYRCQRDSPEQGE